MLDIGFVSAILPDYSIEQVFELARQEQFKCIEMMCWPHGKAERRYAGITHIDIDALDTSRIDKINQLQSEHSIYISALGYYPNPLDPDVSRAAFYIDHIKKLIAAAHHLGIPTITTFVGRDSAKSVNYNVGRFKEIWPDIIRVAEERKIKIAIENCPMIFTADEWPGGHNLASTPAIWDQLFEAVPSDAFGLNYDPSHLVWMQMNEIQPIYDYKDKLFHIHLKDVKVYRDKLDRVGTMAFPLEYHSPKLPGLGDVRWRDFFSALTSVGYRGPVCIEVEDKAYEDSNEDRETALRTSKHFVKQFFG